MFCCNRRNYLKEENDYLRDVVQDILNNQQKINKNVKKIINSFTLKEFVLFKTRLLTKKQTLNLIDNLYIELEIPEKYKEDKYVIELTSYISTPSLAPSGFDMFLAIKYRDYLMNIEELKKILDKLNNPDIKYDFKYDDIKSKWCLNTGIDNTEFLNAVIKTLKFMNLY